MQTVKQGVTGDQRQQVIELRRRHSYREVAEKTGLAIGTVKMIVFRSGAFRDNDKHRAMFTLPPIRSSAETLPSVQELPPQQGVTGDKEVDALLWLRAVIATGQAGPISTAMEAAKKIRTPLKELEGRYTNFLRATNPGNPFATFGSIGFADLELLAERSTQDRQSRDEALARFGDDLWLDTEAEAFCIDTLNGLKVSGALGDFDKGQVAERFKNRPDLMPNTLPDCLREIDYWNELYRLRNAVDRDASDGPAEASARDWFVFGLLAEIRPRSKEEALAVFRYMLASQRDDMTESEAIMLNIIG
ncbi:hypothetical protein M2401_005001 [Pseudomonas sp. JUb42]|uniref:hypothetical protein n=1 Tax=Pseudomonas sp. JUb42 TaxID=2940611 RepID=UPI002167A415|nr:hypothetical protein [Pseudomonas sp. JUb42]MCS3471239.1 hypothetical protein [Pseudomonas sp. JUb42]